MAPHFLNHPSLVRLSEGSLFTILIVANIVTNFLIYIKFLLSITLSLLEMILLHARLFSS